MAPNVHDDDGKSGFLTPRTACARTGLDTDIFHVVSASAVGSQPGQTTRCRTSAAGDELTGNASPAADRGRPTKTAELSTGVD